MRRSLPAALLVAVVATACGDDATADTPATGSTSTSAPITTSTTTATPTTPVAEPNDEERIITVIERFYEVTIEANNPPDPDSPLWDEVVTPDFADTLRETSARNVVDGEGLRYPDPRQPQVIQPRIIVQRGPFAVVDMCLRDDTILYSLADESILNDEVIFVWKQIWMSETAEGWRATTTTSVERFESEDECTASH